MNLRSGPDPLRCLLMAPLGEVGRAIRQVLVRETNVDLLSEVEEFPGPGRLSDWLAHFQPELVFLDISENPLRGDEQIRMIRARRPQCQVVLLHSVKSTDLVVSLLRVGAADFWSPPFAPEVVSSSLGHLARLLHPQFVPQSRKQGRAIAFTSAKPGSGASTLAAQSAFALRRVSGRRVLLIDMNFRTGGGYCWDEAVQATTTSADLFADPSAVLSPDAWSEFTVPLYGVDLVPAPEMPCYMTVSHFVLANILESARNCYDFVVLDLPAVVDRLTLTTLPLVEDACVVTTPELPSLHLTHRSGHILADAGVSLVNTRFILNRATSGDSLASELLKKNLGANLELTIPNDYMALHVAGSAGLPLLGDGKLTKAIRKLVLQFCERQAQQPALAAEPLEVAV